MTIEPLPVDCLPPPDVIEKLLRGPTIGPDGRIVGGMYSGMSVAEVEADRDRYRRMCGE